MAIMEESAPPRRVLVAGGAGFIGSHLCDRLIAEGHDVLCVDNYFTGSKRNIEHLIGHTNFELVRHDVREPMHAEVDEIYNLACPASPVHYQREPVRTIETSLLGAINMLRLAKEVGAVLLQASTSEVYGDPQVHPQTEAYWGHVNPIGPRACYDEGKRCAETLCFDYHRQYGTRTKVARIFNTYGPRLAVGDGRVVSNFVVQALHNESITIYGDGTQTRSFCFVDDMVDGLITLMRAPETILGPINLGNPSEFSINQLAELVIQLTGTRPQIVHRPLPPDDPLRRKPDISRAAHELGWQPTVDLKHGLTKTIVFFRHALSEIAAGAPGGEFTSVGEPARIPMPDLSKAPS
jgi:UDP-glucuronate decarboxylase